MKRNASRFPPDFMFQLTSEESGILKCQSGISSMGSETITHDVVPSHSARDKAVVRPLAERFDGWG